MLNPIKFFFNKRKRAQQNGEFMDELTKLSRMFEIFRQFQRGGLLYCDFNSPNKTVTIAYILAQQFLFDDWNGFLHKLHLFALHQWQVGEYTKAYHKSMADAEARAYQENPKITADGRALARMQAASDFDDAEFRNAHPNPDINFLVLGMVQGQPLLVARLLADGTYHTEPVPEDILEEIKARG